MRRRDVLFTIGSLLAGGVAMRCVSLNANNWRPYTGLWYRNDPTFDYYSGPQATFPSNIRPMAVYAAAVNRTFFTFGDGTPNVVVASYDHSTKQLSSPVVIGAIAAGDGHRTGSLLIDSTGYIYCFYGGHGNPLTVKRSGAPYDIDSAWVSKASIPSANATYPQPWELESGKITLFFRDHPNGIAMCQSTNGGDSWSSPVTIVPNSGGLSTYFITIAEQGAFPRKAHLMWNVFESASMRRDFYYARSDNGGGAWKKSDNTPLGLPISIEGGEQILDSGADQVNTCDMQLDSSGLVRALVLQGLGTSFVWKAIRQNGPGSWSTFALPPSADHHFDIGALALVNDDDWRAYLPSVPIFAGQDGGEIQEWQSLDRGQGWAVIRDITKNSSLIHNNVKAVLGGQPDFRAFWSYGDPDLDGDGIPATADVKLFMVGDDKPARQMASGAPVT